MARKSLLVAFAAVLGMALSAGVAFSQTGWLFGRVRVLGQGAVYSMDMQPLPFTYAFIRDMNDPGGACTMVLRDSATGQFTSTPVGTQSCSTGDE